MLPLLCAALDFVMHSVSCIYLLFQVDILCFPLVCVCVDFGVCVWLSILDNLRKKLRP